MSSGAFLRVTRLLRIGGAVLLSLSWLLLAGAPAQAAITGTYVEQPEAGKHLDRAHPLVVVVERTAPPPEERLGVRTRLLYAGNEPPPPPDGEPAPEEGEVEPPPEPKPVSKKVLDLQFSKQEARPSGDRLYFTGVIDPYNLAWLPEGGVARNGSYILQYRVVGGMGDPDRPWQEFRFRIDAAPAATSMPAVGTADAAAKRMAIAWHPSPTPDLSHYIVERRMGDGEWVVARGKVDHKTTQVTDTVARYGSYRYRVVAVRPAGDGSDKPRTTTSLPSSTFELTPASKPAPRGGNGGTAGAGGDGAGPGDSGGSAPVPSLGAPSTGSYRSQDSADDPSVSPPAGFDDTYRGPLDFGVDQGEVTERVPVEIAQGGTGEDSTLRVLARSIDQERVLPPLAGGLILVVSAAHVVRYLNE